MWRQVIGGVVVLCALAQAPAAVAQLRAVDGLAALDAGDPEGARRIWEPLASRGDVLAQYNLGVMALTGQGGPRDEALGLRLLEAAAVQGHAPAQRALVGQALGRADRVAAGLWLEALAEAGESAAQFALGQMFDLGIGGAADPQAAARWYRAAALQGLVEAEFALGALLAEEGEEPAAVEWFRAAAGQGHPAAMHNLAVALEQGAGVARDEQAARRWYLQAAQAGHGPAMHNLALMQARGRGGAERFRFAKAWALNAAEAGVDDSADLAAALRSVMADALVQEAERLAPECRAGRLDCD